MTRRDSRSRKRQPRRRSPRRGIGAWLPVIIVGLGAVGIVVMVIAINAGVDGDSPIQTIDFPERTVPTFDRTSGYEEAPLTVKEYSDFQCPYCALSAATLVPQIEQGFIADKRVKLEFHPMAFAGEESTWAAEAAECANDQGRFWDYHDTLFENQGAFAIDKLKGFARELGLDTEPFNECLESHKHEESVKAKTQEALNQGIASTPTFVIGERVIPGPRSYEELRQAIEAELEETP
jgi:protein-disulfide isomerase